MSVIVGMSSESSLFERAAVLSQDPLQFENISILTNEEKEDLRREQTHRWSHTSRYPHAQGMCIILYSLKPPIHLSTLYNEATLYWLVTACSMAAAVQGVSATHSSALPV